jgi:hypothetical protein
MKEIFMKNLVFRAIPFSVILIFSSFCRADQKCFDFDTEGYSQKIRTLTLAFPDFDFKSKQMITVTGTPKNGKTIYVNFECNKKVRKINCVQNDGGGDFSLTRQEPYKIELTYLNLAIGAYSGTASAKPDVELNEDFAILSQEESSESDHLHAFQLKGISRVCRQSDLVAPK